MQNDDEKVKNFCHDHNIRVIDTNKRAVRYFKINVNYFNDQYDYNKVMTHSIPMETEPLYTVEIAESELRKIASFESEVFNHMKQRGHYDMFGMLMEQKERENYLKNKYPAVKKAYEQYSLILKLAESGDYDKE
jgi:hypothetical protein